MYNKNRRSAFTLIELLVVIAIIAILAAILFPVFAQAKAAAKDSAALSNVKQMATGHLLYSTDYDDVFCPMITRQAGLFSTDSTGSSVIGAWQGIIRPYTKNMQIAYHPKSTAPAGNDTQKWIKEWQFWGVVPRVSALQNTTTTGTAFIQDATLTGGVASFMDGPFGAAVDPTPYNNTRSSASYSQTSIENISEVIMIAEGTSYDFAWGRNAQVGPGQLGIFCAAPGITYATTQHAYGTSTIIGSPTARKSAAAGADGVSGCAYPKGMTTYAATDGSAKAVDYRGRIWERTTTASGQVVLRRMWAGAL